MPSVKGTFGDGALSSEIVAELQRCCKVASPEIPNWHTCNHKHSVKKNDLAMTSDLRAYPAGDDAEQRGLGEEPGGDQLQEVRDAQR